MFKTCQRWQKERSAPLIVTADELFKAIHFELRLTSKATIAWELWRRLAFRPLVNGRYQFHPEKGANTRTLGRSIHQASLQIHNQSRAVKVPNLWTSSKSIFGCLISISRLMTCGLR